MATAVARAKAEVQKAVKKDKAKKKKSVALVPFTTQSTVKFKDSNVKAGKLVLAPARSLVDEMAQSQVDVTEELGKVKFHFGREYPTGLGLSFGKTREVFGLTPWAFAQLGNRLEAPASFLWKLFSRNRMELFKHNVMNLQDEHKADELLFRAIGPTRAGKSVKGGWNGSLIRGVLTTGFTATDNGAVLAALDETLPDTTRLEGSVVTPDFMTLRLIDRGNSVNEVRGGKKSLFGGLVITNSEVGRRSLGIDAFIYRLVCSNGLMLPQSVYMFRRRHTGDATEEFIEELQTYIGKLPEYVAQTQKATEAARAKVLTIPRVKHMIEVAVQDTDGAKPLVTMGGHDEDAVVKQLIDSAKHEAAGTGGRYTRWGVINALTRAAHGLPAEPRMKVESYAGQLLLSTN